MQPTNCGLCAGSSSLAAACTSSTSTSTGAKASSSGARSLSITPPVAARMVGDAVRSTATAKDDAGLKGCAAAKVVTR